MSDTPSELPPEVTAAFSGRYEVVRELGRGGMAAVYLATDVKHGREVAIKVLHPELAATIGADRFEREIRVAAKLQHPHILGMFDSGESNGLLFYVMPFVKGESLRDRIDREGMLPVEDALQICLEVNDALGYAHRQGIVHRDIKPENIMLSDGHALVADFGIARAVTDGGTERKLTQTGMSMGTPYYMAPEQASGETVGPTADLYALGCVLYEMLAGEPPFTGKNAMQIMARHAMEQVPSIRIVRSVVPEEVEQAIYIAMNKAPQDRPQSAEQFAQLLGMPMGSTATMRMMTPTMQRRIPSGAQTAISAMQVTPWWKKPAALATAAVVVAAAGFGAWKFGGGRQPSATSDADARRLAVLYFTTADSALTPIADGLTEGLIRSLTAASQLTVISTQGVAKYRGTDVKPDSISRAFRVGYLVRGDVDKDGKDIKVTVRLDDKSGTNISRTSLSFLKSNVASARDTLAVLVGDIIKKQLHEEIALQTQRTSASNEDAWLLYQRGEAARRQLMTAALVTKDTVAGFTAYRQADSLYADASKADSKWADPLARRAQINYLRARFTGDPAEVRKWVATGLPFAEQAIKLDPENADAYEQRGALTYFHFLAGGEQDNAKRTALITAAKKDLEQATTLNKTQASAFSMYAHLLNNFKGSTPSDILLAAQRAYEADEFLTDAETVLSRLWLANYDMGQTDRADQWCAESRRRFPAAQRSARCELLVLTMPNKKADVARAWLLADSLAKFANNAPTVRLNANLLAAMVIGKAKLADSAKHVIKKSEGDATIDPKRELALYAAMAYATAGDNADAIRMLKEYFAANPGAINGYRDEPGWQFKELASDPAFKQLVGAK